MLLLLKSTFEPVGIAGLIFSAILVLTWKRQHRICQCMCLVLFFAMLWRIMFFSGTSTRYFSILIPGFIIVIGSSPVIFHKLRIFGVGKKTLYGIGAILTSCLLLVCIARFVFREHVNKRNPVIIEILSRELGGSKFPGFMSIRKSWDVYYRYYLRKKNVNLEIPKYNDPEQRFDWLVQNCDCFILLSKDRMTEAFIQRKLKQYPALKTQNKGQYAVKKDIFYFWTVDNRYSPVWGTPCPGASVPDAKTKNILPYSQWDKANSSKTDFSRVEGRIPQDLRTVEERIGLRLPPCDQEATFLIKTVHGKPGTKINVREYIHERTTYRNIYVGEIAHFKIPESGESKRFFEFSCPALAPEYRDRFFVLCIYCGNLQISEITVSSKNDL